MKSILLLVFLVSSICFAQRAQQKNLSGKVVIDEEENLDLSSIDVLNLTSNYKTTTNRDGDFLLPIKIGDTIQFSSMGLLPRKIVMNPDLYMRGFVQVHMNVEVIELQTALVNPLKLDRYEDQSDMTYLYNQLGIYQKSYKEVAPRVVKNKSDLHKFTPAKILAPVELIGHINGHYRKKRNLDFYENQNYFATKIMDYLPTDYFTDELTIPEERIKDFIFFTIHNTDIEHKVNPEKYFEIGLFLEETAPKYLRELYQENS